MTHIRSQIRAAAVNAVKGSSQAGSRVYDSLSLPVSSDSGAAILVYATREQARMLDQGAITRDLTLRFDVVVKEADGTAQNTLDAVAVWIEQKIYADPTFSDLALASRLDATNFASNGNGETTLAIMSLTFVVTYLTSEGDPETAI